MSLVRTIRQKLDIDSDTPLDLSVWRNNSTIFEVAVYQGSSVADISDIESINLKIRPSRVNETILADDTATVFDETLTDTTWLDGTKEHASFTFTNSNMNLDLDDQYEAEFWIVFTAILDGGEERTLATGTITFKEDNNGAGDPPAENPGTAITIDQGDARYALTSAVVLKADQTALDALELAKVNITDFDDYMLPPNGHVLYLDPIHGNDLLASVNAPMRPFKTWEAVASSTSDNATIVCLSGGTIEVTKACEGRWINLFAPNADIVRGAGYTNWLFSDDSQDGEKSIIARSITGKNLFSLNTDILNVKATTIALTDDVNISGAAHLAGLHIGVASPQVNIDCEVLSSTLNGRTENYADNSVETDQVLLKPSSPVNSGSPTFNLNSRLYNNISFGLGTSVNRVVFLNVKGHDIINDNPNFDGGLLGFIPTYSHYRYDEVNINLTGCIKSYAGASSEVIYNVDGKQRIKVDGGIFALDARPVMSNVTYSQTSVGASASTYIKTPVMHTEGSIVMIIANANRDVWIEDAHLTSSDSTALICNTIYNGGNDADSTIMFKNCTSDLDGNAAYTITSGVIDLATVNAAMSHVNVKNDIFLEGEIKSITTLDSTFINKFKLTN